MDIRTRCGRDQEVARVTLMRPNKSEKSVRLVNCSDVISSSNSNPFSTILTKEEEGEGRGRIHVMFVVSFVEGDEALK